MKRAVLDALNAARAEGRPAVLATTLDSGAQEILTPGTMPAGSIGDAARRVLRLDAAERVDNEAGEEVFLRPFNPPLRLALVGAVHISQPLVTMARLAGYAVTVIDPRESFAQAARFPDVEVSTEWPDDALEELRLDARSAVVTLTHDPKLDDPALETALKSEAFYIGALGSRKTHAARKARLTEAGFDEAAQARIAGPVGLAIGAKSPAEIAISIMAQMTEALRKPEAASR